MTLEIIAMAMATAALIISFMALIAVYDRVKNESNRTELTPSYRRRINRHLIDFNKCKYDPQNEILLVCYKDGSDELFEGSCTVWRYLDTFERCSTPVEAVLADVWKYTGFHGQFTAFDMQALQSELKNKTNEKIEY